MFYEYAVSVPASTTETSPKKDKFKLAHGIIQRIDIQFPIGTQALAHARLQHHSFGTLPSNPSGSFASDGYIISVTAPLEFIVGPYEVDAICWNDDDTYAHVITFRFDMTEAKVTMWLLSLLKGLEKMLRVMGIRI